MRSNISKRLARLSVMMLFFYSYASFSKELKHLTGIAKLENGNIFYKEDHLITLENNKTIESMTTYYNGNGKKIAELHSDYTKSSYLPDCQFKDARDGYEYTLQFNKSANEIELTTKESSNASSKKSKIKFEPNMMVQQGALQYIGDNIEILKKLKPIDVLFVIPSRHDSMAIVIEPIEFLKSEKKLNLRLKAKNSFLRMMVSETLITFDTDKLQITEFAGVSNLLDDHDKSQKVKIHYQME